MPILVLDSIVAPKHRLICEFRLQLLAFLKSDWSDAWLLLLIVTRTVNSIEPASYSRNLVHITYYSGH